MRSRKLACNTFLLTKILGKCEIVQSNAYFSNRISFISIIRRYHTRGKKNPAGSTASFLWETNILDLFFIRVYDYSIKSTLPALVRCKRNRVSLKLCADSHGTVFLNRQIGGSSDASPHRAARMFQKSQNELDCV